MLPAPHRLRSSADFSRVLKSGRRVGRGRVVVHIAVRDGSVGEVATWDTGGSVATRFGLVVGRSAGNSVTRHRISRRLRAQLSRRITDVPAGCDVVVRALPAAAGATSAELGADLDRAFARLAASRGKR